MRSLVSIAVLVFCIFMCCGLGSLIVDRDRSNAPTAKSWRGESTRQGMDLVTPSEQQIEDEISAQYDQRMLEYEAELATWQAHAERQKTARTELDDAQSRLATTDARRPSKPKFEERVWTSVDKKYHTQATLIDTDNFQVELVKDDGEKVEVEKEGLIAEDRVYVQLAFISLTTYRKELNEWQVARDKVSKEVAAILEQIDDTSPPKPAEPSRENIASEIRNRIKAEIDAQKQEEISKQRERIRKQSIDSSGTRVAGQKQAQHVLEQLGYVPTSAEWPWETIHTSEFTDGKTMPPRFLVAGTVESGNSVARWTALVMKEGESIVGCAVSFNGELIWTLPSYAARLGDATAQDAAL